MGKKKKENKLQVQGIVLDKGRRFLVDTDGKTYEIKEKYKSRNVFNIFVFVVMFIVSLMGAVGTIMYDVSMDYADKSTPIDGYIWCASLVCIVSTAVFAYLYFKEFENGSEKSQ